MQLLSLKADGTPWWVTVRNWHAAEAASSPRWCCLRAMPQTARTLWRWLKSKSPTPGVIPAMTSADDGYSSKQGLEEVQGLGVKVVSISGAKGKKLFEARQWKSKPYREARAERSAIESLVFTLKEGFEFGQMARRNHENVHAEMLEKVLAYNVSQIIRVRKKLLELQSQAAA